MLDKIQKKQPLTLLEEKHLKSKKLVEGRKPNYYISIGIAQKTGLKASYTKHRAFDKTYYLDFILTAIRQHSSLNRQDIDELLWEKLPDWMTDDQKKHKINNLLSELRRKNKIRNEGNDFRSKWVLIT